MKIVHDILDKVQASATTGLSPPFTFARAGLLFEPQEYLSKSLP